MAWVLLPYPGGRQKGSKKRDREGRAMLLTTLITVGFIGVSSVILWLSIGAE
jgi:hypothetical protein